ncbi:uncharacterized protein LOC143774114 [Ranitomeya variabilis]|uniref:uncharacterized protein LOC143774114 n=1 Tax=Ranitomeya variabilis TaxID=490064 RepID=UPI004055F9B1
MSSSEEQNASHRRLMKTVQCLRAGAVDSGPSSSGGKTAEREEGTIDNDSLIMLVQQRVPLWNTRDLQHSDTVVIRLLWDEVAKSLLDDWDTATPSIAIWSDAAVNL